MESLMPTSFDSFRHRFLSAGGPARLQPVRWIIGGLLAVTAALVAVRSAHAYMDRGMWLGAGAIGALLIIDFVGMFVLAGARLP